MGKILILANTSWAIYNFRKELIIALQKKGYNVIIVSQKDDYTEKIEKLGAKYLGLEYDNSSKNPINDIFLLLKIIRIFFKEKPALVLTFAIKANIYGNFGARICGIPIISNISGMGSLFINFNLVSKMTLKLYKFSLTKTSKIFFQNNTDYLLFKNSGIIAKQNTDVLPGSGVDLKRFKSNKINNDMDEKVKFILVARLLKDKGIVEYIAAIKSIKPKFNNVVFQLLGEIWPKNPSSIKKEEVDNWVDLGLIDYLGFTEDVRPFIEAADVIILPSYREGMARTLLEAASMSKPLIATDVPGCREIVENGINGYLCNVKDSKDLEDKMLKMLNLSSNKRKEMGLNSRKKMEKEFDEQIVIDKYLSSIKAILNTSV